MGVRVTDSTNVALYDSTGGYAFGQVFTSDEDAYEFLAWLRQEDARDPRNMTIAQLGDFRERWERERAA